MAERRREQRLDMVLRVDYLDAGDLLSDYISNLGIGGIFIATSLPLEIGHHLSFTLSFPGLLEPQPLAGIVRWRINRDGEEGRVGLGVEFIFEDEAQQQQLIDLLALARTLSRTAPGEAHCRILLVEDNKFVLDLFNYAIKRFHMSNVGAGTLEIILAQDAEVALRNLEQAPVDLAIIDHYLPGLSGCDLVRLLRKTEAMREAPLLMVSAGGEQVKRLALESGADLFLDKPVLHKELINTLNMLLAKTTRALPPSDPESSSR